METYGVTFENFRSDWGIDYYREIENMAIPACREALSHYETLLTGLRTNLERVKQASEVAKSLIRLTEELQELSDGKKGDGGDPFHNLLTCPDLPGEQGEMEDRANAVARIESWMIQTYGVRGDVEDVFGFAKEVMEYKVEVCERHVREWKANVDFYEKSLEAQRYEYVFDNVDKKYKVRISRDLTKLLTEVVKLGEIVKNAVRKDGNGDLEANTAIAGLHEDAKHMLNFFKEFKTVVANFGIDEACEMVTKKLHQNVGAHVCRGTDSSSGVRVVGL